MSHYKTTLPDEAATQALGKQLARLLQPGLCLHLHGDLGAGKTALTRALIHAAGYSGHVKSPTYTLVEQYPLQLAGTAVNLLHFDLYRMGSPEEFTDAGLLEEFNPQQICIVEWPEKAEGLLPPADIRITLAVAGDGREVELQALSVRGKACLASLQFAPIL